MMMFRCKYWLKPFRNEIYSKLKGKEIEYFKEISWAGHVERPTKNRFPKYVKRKVH
jgi:hypothetical protein